VWVEQQGVPLDDFERRKDQTFWNALTAEMPIWDKLIDKFNAEVAIR